MQTSSNGVGCEVIGPDGGRVLPLRPFSCREVMSAPQVALSNTAAKSAEGRTLPEVEGRPGVISGQVAFDECRTPLRSAGVADGPPHALEVGPDLPIRGDAGDGLP